MKVLIVDDEKRTLEGLTAVVKATCPEVCEIVTASKLSDAEVALNKHLPDLILLDINLGDGSGFDLIPAIQRMKIPVIFITAHEEFALRAFQVAAIHYLLKPVDPEELAQGVRRAFHEFQKKSLEAGLQLLIEQHSNRNQLVSRIVLKTSESIHIVEIADIEYCESDKNYTTFVMNDGNKILVSRTIGEYEELLSKHNFLRIHQSYLLNPVHLTRYDRSDGGMIITSGGHQLPVSSRKKDVVMNYLNGLG